MTFTILTNLIPARSKVHRDEFPNLAICCCRRQPPFLPRLYFLYTCCVVVVATRRLCVRLGEQHLLLYSGGCFSSSFDGCFMRWGHDWAADASHGTDACWGSARAAVVSAVRYSGNCGMGWDGGCDEMGSCRLALVLAGMGRERQHGMAKRGSWDDGRELWMPRWKTAGCDVLYQPCRPWWCAERAARFGILAE